MSKPLDLEMQLVNEPDASLSDSATYDKADISDKEQAKQTESEDLRMLPQSGVQHRKWAVLAKSIDPVFYTTCLIFSSLLFVGSYFFVTHNNQIVTAHLKVIQASNKELSEKLARSKYNNVIETPVDTLVSQKEAKMILPVQTQSLKQVDAVFSAATKNVVLPETPKDTPPIELASTPILNTGAEQIDEVAHLQGLLAEKRQQLDLLALENHELRLQIEFGESDDIFVVHDSGSDPDIFNTDNVVLSTDSSQSMIAAPEILISENQRIDEFIDIDQLIERASAALIDKNYADADKWYLDALQQSPGNRAANLGVASVALVTGRTQLAINRYRHLLQLYPDDQVVFSLMLDLAAPENVVETELLNHVGRRVTDRAGMYSILGRYFGRTARWGAANDAFGAALQWSTGQPADILFNLAVSFEHLGQTDNAVKSYLQVLGVDDNTGVDLTLVHQRLGELTE